MPWQEVAHQHVSQHAEAVHVVAGNDAGMLHIWAVAGSGQETWQLVAIQNQVKLSHVYATTQRRHKHL